MAAWYASAAFSNLRPPLPSICPTPAAAAQAGQSDGRLNLPLIGLWVKLLSVPYRLLYPLILLCCAIGAYSTNNNMFDVWVAIVFGFLGYIFLKLECEPAPLLLGYILGPLLEENLRRALVLSRGDYTVFATRPMSAVMLLMALGLLILVVLPTIRKKRETVFQET